MEQNQSFPFETAPPFFRPQRNTRAPFAWTRVLSEDPSISGINAGRLYMLFRPHGRQNFPGRGGIGERQGRRAVRSNQFGVLDHIPDHGFPKSHHVVQDEGEAGDQQGRGAGDHDDQSQFSPHGKILKLSHASSWLSAWDRALTGPNSTISS